MIRCLVDSNGYFLAVVAGNYDLKKGQKLISIYPPKEIKAKWNGAEWIETATSEEIEEYKRKQYRDMGLLYPPEEYISDEKRRQLETETALMELAEMLADTQAALLEMGGINNG